MKLNAITLISTLLITSGSICEAQTPITVKEVINKALQNNLGLKVQKLAPQIAAQNTIKEEAEFDVTISGTAARNKRETSSTNNATIGTAAENFSAQVSASKRFSTGGQASLTTDFSRSDSNAGTIIGGNLNHDSSVTLEVRQPLWKGAGTDNTLAGVRKAQSSHTEAELRLLTNALDVAELAEKRYWNLSYAQTKNALYQSSLELAQQLLEETLVRQEAGLVTNIDVLEAQAALSNRKEIIISSKQLIDDNAELLLESIAELNSGNYLQIPVAENLPEEFNKAPSINSIITRALDFDPSLSAQAEVIKQRELDVRQADNLLNPQLDLVASGQLLGRDALSSSESFRNAIDRDGYRWNLQMNFSMPWGMRAEKASLQQTRLRLSQEENRLINLKEMLVREARSLWRSVNSGLARLEAASITLNLREQTFEQTKEKYSAGLVPYRTVLEAQRDLDNAKISRLDAIIELIRSDVDLARIEGSLLERYGLSI